jgi:aspartate oxidase
MRGPDATPVHNVLVVGGGEAGLAIALGSGPERDSGVVIRKKFETYDEPDAWEAVRAGGSTAG